MRTVIDRIVEEGHKLLTVVENGKKPVARNWPNLIIEPSEIIAHVQRGGNVGWQHGLGTIAIDCDGRPSAEETWKLFGPFSTIVRTRRGIHFICAYDGDDIGNFVKARGLFDIRGKHGYTVCPPSRIDGFQYEFVEGYDEIRKDYMTVFDPEWLPKQTVSMEQAEKSGDMVVRAVHWTNAIPGEPEGYRDNKLFYVACKLVRFFGLSKIEAYPILVSFAARCEPPVTNQKQLLRKLDEAEKGK